MRAQRRDNNESALVRLARQVGAKVIYMQAGQGCDFLLLSPGKISIIEVKDGRKSPSERRLTADEMELALTCQTLHIPYHVILNEGDLMRVLEQNGKP